MSYTALFLNIAMIFVLLFLAFALLQWSDEVLEYNNKIDALGCRAVCIRNIEPVYANYTNITWNNNTKCPS